MMVDAKTEMNRLLYVLLLSGSLCIVLLCIGVILKKPGLLRLMFVFLGLSFMLLSIYLIMRCAACVVRRKSVAATIVNEGGEDINHLDIISGMPRIFSFNELEVATANFSKRLGKGGFGFVFEGNLGNTTKIAVKRLHEGRQGTKEFLAEVKTIGSHHHVNLVHLVGFCAEESHKLLVYEYMCNGSLDKWIFNRNQDLPLSWQTKRKIILHIAQGLNYLHRECRRTIIHFDIKPENVLLDSKFNAKVADFGLARFIDRDRSHVSTGQKGTPGYWAPEWWLKKKITEKVDVYSFGVVVLEIIAGRKNVDHSLPEEKDSLFHLVKKKAEEDRLFDLVDKQSDDILQHKEEAVRIIRTAIWCLQTDSANRPSMSVVVNILEGLMDVETTSDYSYLTLTPMEPPRQSDKSGSNTLLPVTLSGPR